MQCRRVLPNKLKQVSLPSELRKGDNGIGKTKPYRGPPWLGKKLLALRKQVIDTALQRQFQQPVFAELEAVAMDQVAASGR